LKQLVVGDCAASLQALFIALFPRFFDKLEWNWSEESKRVYSQAPGIELAQPKLARRFGGLYLPRSRYHTVCRDAHGDDGGTLINELRAYRDPARTGMVEVMDMGLGSSALASGERVYEFERAPVIAAVIHEPERLGQQLESVASEAIARPDGKEARLVRFPYRLRELELPATVDLRVPGTRQWFYEQFSAPNDDWIWPESLQGGVPFPDPPKTFISEYEWSEGRAPLPQSFEEMLPTMLNPIRGGGDVAWGGATLTAIGEWLRNRDVEALIYPAARSDWRVLYQNGEMRDFSGWCLADYRHPAAEDRVNYVMFDSSPWSWVRLPRHVELFVGKEGSEFAGSLSLEGAVKESASDYVDRVACLRAAEHNVGPRGRVATPRGAFAIGTYSLRWLHIALLSGAKECTDAFRTFRGLLLQLGKEQLANRLRDILLRRPSDGNLLPALKASIEMGQEIQETIEGPQEIKDIVAAAIDLELAQLLLSRATKSVPAGLSANGLRKLALPQALRVKADDFLALLKTAGGSLQSCARCGAELGSSLAQHYARLSDLPNG
jgi:hypothetical protein